MDRILKSQALQGLYDAATRGRLSKINMLFEYIEATDNGLYPAAAGYKLTAMPLVVRAKELVSDKVADAVTRIESAIDSIQAAYLVATCDAVRAADGMIISAAEFATLPGAERLERAIRGAVYELLAAVDTAANVAELRAIAELQLAADKIRREYKGTRLYGAFRREGLDVEIIQHYLIA